MRNNFDMNYFFFTLSVVFTAKERIHVFGQEEICSKFKRFDGQKIVTFVYDINETGLNESDSIRNYLNDSNICMTCFQSSLAQRSIKSVRGSYFLNFVHIEGEWYTLNGVDLSPVRAIDGVVGENNKSVIPPHGALQPNVTYGVAHEENGNSVIVKIQGEWEYEQKCSHQEISRRKNNTVLDSICVNHIVCQRPFREKCVYQRKPDRCKHLPKYGCHILNIWIGLEPENPQGQKCNVTFEKQASQCEPDECSTCTVTQWSWWSGCDADACGSTGHSTRFRNITNLHNCTWPEVYNLEQEKNCTIEGCDKLRDVFE